MAGDRVEFQQTTDGGARSNMANVATDSQLAVLPKVPTNDAAANAVPDVELFDSVQEQINASNDGIRATVTPGPNDARSDGIRATMTSGTLDCRPNSETAPDRPDSETAPDRPDSETAPDRPDSETAPERPMDMGAAARDVGSLLKDAARQGQLSSWWKDFYHKLPNLK